MTHEELLAKLRDDQHGSDSEGILKALRAVVELHKPKKGPWSNTDLLACSICYEQGLYDPELEPETYPCPTIQAIEKELS